MAYHTLIFVSKHFYFVINLILIIFPAYNCCSVFKAVRKLIFSYRNLSGIFLNFLPNISLSVPNISLSVFPCNFLRHERTEDGVCSKCNRCPYMDEEGATSTIISLPSSSPQREIGFQFTRRGRLCRKPNLVETFGKKRSNKRSYQKLLGK